MKKKVFIFSHAMEIGGAERALLGLLTSFDYSKYEVDLFLLRHDGELYELIPKEVNVIKANSRYSCLGAPIKNCIKTFNFGILLGRMYASYKAKKFDKKMNYESSLAAFDYSHKYTKRFMPMMSDKEYDLAISFLIPHYFVAEKVIAKKKIAWIHTDYSYLNMDVESEVKMWSVYDHIVSISNDVTKGFLSKFPSLEKKIVYIENILSKDFIDKQSLLFDVEDEMHSNCLKLLSVGRFSDAKNFDNVPEIASIIKSNGIDFKWYIVGYGDQEELICSKIKDFSMEDTVIILGKKENPYPYIKACDIYIQPSRYEGKAVTVHEAQILNKPVVITNYSTANSQLRDGFDGIIVPLDNEECAKALISFINDKALQEQIINNMRTVNYSNECEINKLYKIIGD